MISRGEKDMRRKDLKKFIEQNFKGIRKIGVAASGRHVHKKGGGGLFCFFLGHFVQWICSGPFFAFPFPLCLSSEGELISLMNDWMNEWMIKWTDEITKLYTSQPARVQHNNNNNYYYNGALVARGFQKGRFQQWDTTHSGTGEKETYNINVVGTTGT